MQRLLRNYLNRNYGVIINVSNSTFEYKENKLIISIPVEELEKFSSSIENHNNNTLTELNKEQGFGFITRPLTN